MKKNNSSIIESGGAKSNICLMANRSPVNDQLKLNEGVDHLSDIGMERETIYGRKGPELLLVL